MSSLRSREGRGFPGGTRAGLGEHQLRNGSGPCSPWGPWARQPWTRVKAHKGGISTWFSAVMALAETALSVLCGGWAGAQQSVTPEEIDWGQTEGFMALEGPGHAGRGVRTKEGRVVQGAVP